jgi:subtilisin family serine protease
MPVKKEVGSPKMCSWPNVCCPEESKSVPVVSHIKTTCTILAAFFGWLLLASSGADAPKYVEGEVIVTFKAAATAEAAQGVLKKKSLAFAQHFGLLSAKRRRQMGMVRDKTKTTVQLLAALKDDPNVESVEPNYLRWVKAAPNDTRFGEMWALNNTGQVVNGTAGTASDDVKFIAARALSRTPGSEIVVGVIDTGLDYVHPDLAANVWVNNLETPLNGVDEDHNGYTDDYHGYDFVDGDADPSDSGEHGTHVAGTIAAIGENQMGVIGIDDKVRILPLKVSSDGDTISSAAAISALQYATALKNRGVNIVALNASYGGGGFSSAESAAIQAAGDAGIIMCVAAGNESANNDTTPTYPASYRLANMIVVAASDQNDALASFSNRGATTVDLAAPGTNILSTKPSTITFQAGNTTYASDAFTFSGATTGLSGAIIDCGTGNTAAEFPSSVRGNIALIQRGTETFSTKVTNAMNAGATAAIIYNNVSGSFVGTLQTASNWIPARSISQADGLAIKASLPRNGAIVVTGNFQFLNGTSMATPHVTGAVAFAAMNFPGDTMAQRRQRILAGVEVKASLQGKVATGGRLNLLRLVDANSDGVPDWQPVITTATLPSAIDGVAYSQTLAATSGTAPYTWSLASGTLPPGFSLSSAGVLSGTTSATGSYPITVRATDNVSAAGTRALTLNVAVSGPLHHFAWDFLPISAYSGTHFAVKVTARDSGNRVVVDASGTLNLSALSGGNTALPVSPSSVAISGGSFTGYLSIPTAGANVTLTATQNTSAGTSGSFTVLSGNSTANDGLPDAWKNTNGLSAAANVAALDTDGDGMTNLQEFVAGTDPQLPSSAFRVTSIDTDHSTFFKVHFNGAAGKLYRLSASSDLITWLPLGTPLLSTINGMQTLSAPLSGNAAAFFRVEIAP